MRRVEEFHFEALGRGLWLLIFPSAMLADFYVWLKLCLAESDAMVAIILYHLLLTALMSASYYLINEKTEVHRMLIICLMCSLILPFFGPLMILLYELFWAYKEITPFTEPEAKLYEFSRRQTGHLEDALEIIDSLTPEEVEEMTLRWTDIQPLSDVIRNGELMEKCHALNSAAKNPTRDSVALLKIALKDSSSEVRFYASNALSQVEEQLLQILTDLQQAHEKEPHREELRFRLVDFYIRSCELNIFSEVTVIHYLSSALHIIENEADSALVKEIKCRIFRRLGRWQAILDMLKGEIHLRNLQFYVCEALLRTRDFTKLKDVLNSMDISQYSSEDERDLITFWKEAVNA